MGVSATYLDRLARLASQTRFSARVAITLCDGRVLTRTTTVVRGDAGNPVPRAELAAKFRALAAGALGPAGTERVVEAVGRLPELKDVRDLTGLLGIDHGGESCSTS